MMGGVCKVNKKFIASSLYAITNDFILPTTAFSGGAEPRRPLKLDQLLASVVIVEAPVTRVLPSISRP